MFACVPARFVCIAVRVSGGGSWRCTNQSRTWRIRFTISKMPMFLKFTHMQAHTDTLVQSPAHTPLTQLVNVQRGLWRLVRTDGRNQHKIKLN